MKKLLLLISFLVFVYVFSQDNKVEITYTNGNVESGFASGIGPYTSVISFKTSEKAKKKKVKADEIAQIVYYFEDSEPVTAVPKYSGKIKGDGTSKVVPMKFLFYRYYTSDNLEIYTTEKRVDNVQLLVVSTRADSIEYYIGKNGDDNIYFYNLEQPRVVHVNLDKGIMSILTYLFEEQCPKIVEEASKINFKMKDAATQLIELNKAHCN